MRSYNRRLLLFGILATTVSAALVVLAIGVVRDPRPSTAAARVTTTVPDEPEPIETAHSRELTKVLDGSTIVPNSIKLDTPFRWQPDSLHGVDYGETYSAEGTVVDARGYWRAGVSASVARVDRKKLHELLQRSGDGLDGFEMGSCAPPEQAQPGATCVTRLLPDGTKASVTLSDGRRAASLRAVRPDGTEIQVGFRGMSGAHSEGDYTFDVDTVFRFAELPGLRM